MGHAADALIALGGAFLVCGLLARGGMRLGLPTVPLFMLAGVVFGPNTAGIDLVGDPADLELVARIGLVFLLFYLGLEFSLDQLIAGGRKLIEASLIYLVLNIGGGLIYGYLLGWGTAEAFVIAGVVGISSTAIVTKLLVENRRLTNRETRTLLGIAVIEDIFLAFYLALLQPVLGGAENAREAIIGIVTAFTFLLILGALARYGSNIVGRLVNTDDEEIVVVVFVGLAIITAGIAELLGVSDAIGAFMVGLILGATAKARRLRDLTHPLRDAFGAIFFFHFGLTIDPGEVIAVIPQTAIAVVMTIVLATAAGVFAARMHGFDRIEAANIGFTVLTRGEFSIILAALAVGAGLDTRVSSLAAGYVLVLAIVGPVLASRSDIFSRAIPQRFFGDVEPEEEKVIPLDLTVGTSSLYQLGTELLQIKINPGSCLHGMYVYEMRLPEGSTLGVLSRDGQTVALEPTTRLRTGDTVLVFTHPEQRDAAERRILAVHREGRLARWRGEVGD